MFLDPSYKANGNDLEMKLKDFLSVLFLDRQIEIKTTIAMFKPKHKQKRLLRKKNII